MTERDRTGTVRCLSLKPHIRAARPGRGEDATMVQGYWTLQEAAQVLGMPPEELKQMAQRNQIRSFQDRGTWRFRVQDIQELARQRGASSDLELVLGDAPARSPQPKSAGPKSGPRSPGPRSPTAPRPGSPPPRSPSQKAP